jgi:surface-anchored protein
MHISSQTGVTLLWILTLWVSIACLPSQAGTDRATLTNEHIDFKIVYHAETNHLELVVRDEDRGVDHAADQVILELAESARILLPPGTPFGPENAPFWVMPQSAAPDLLYAGFSAEGLSPVIFQTPLDVRLIRVEGPGQFYAWQASAFGGLDVRMNSADGVTEADATTPLAGSHEHFNFGFSASGVYRVTMRAFGRDSQAATNVVSPESTFLFHVLPLPAESPFQLWQKSHWADGAAEARPDADPDADGIINLAEYAFGLNPEAPEQGRLPEAVIVRENGLAYGGVSFLRSTAATDVAIRVVASDSLSAPTWESLSETSSVIAVTPTVDRVVIRDRRTLAEALHGFFQFRIELRSP